MTGSVESWTLMLPPFCVWMSQSSPSGPPLHGRLLLHRLLLRPAGGDRGKTGDLVSQIQKKGRVRRKTCDEVEEADGVLWSAMLQAQITLIFNFSTKQNIPESTIYGPTEVGPMLPGQVTHRLQVKSLLTCYLYLWSP